MIYKVIIYKALDCLRLWEFVGSGAILGIGNKDKEKGDKRHIMHYKLVVGGTGVFEAMWQRYRDKMTKIKNKNK